MNQKRRRILVVNDTEEILELFHDILEGMGHEMIPLTYAPDDLQQIVEIMPDLAIIDFVMGGLEYRGWQLVQKLRMHRLTANIPLIICTAAKREVYEQEGWLTEKGVSIVLKPFDIEDLERAIERAFSTAEMRRTRPGVDATSR
ncbi:MAG TPA: response regulator [Candidatus Limnocylindria bacterium]|nr:response regulator [Candidatus Limnocylindria bacterium]